MTSHHTLLPIGITVLQQNQFLRLILRHGLKPKHIKFFIPVKERMLVFVRVRRVRGFGRSIEITTYHGDF